MKNPGQYTDLKLNCTRHYIEKYCGPTPPAVEVYDLTSKMAALGVLILFTMLLIVSAVITVRLHRNIDTELGDERHDWDKRATAPGGRAATVFQVVAVIAGFAVFISASVFAETMSKYPIPYHRHGMLFGLIPEEIDERGTNFDKYEHAASLDGYRERVQAWLDHDYGIDVNAAAVGILQDGGQVAVTYNGKQVAIEFMTAGDGGLAIRQTDGQVLEPSA